MPVQIEEWVSTIAPKWIDQLRDWLSELISSLRFLNLRRDGSLALAEHEWIERFQRAFQLSSKVALLLNPHEDDHKALHAALQEAGSLLQSTSDDRSEKDRRRHPARPSRSSSRSASGIG